MSDEMRIGLKKGMFGVSYDLMFRHVLCISGLREHIFLPIPGPEKIDLVYTRQRLNGVSFALKPDGHLKGVSEDLLIAFLAHNQTAYQQGYRFGHVEY